MIEVHLRAMEALLRNKLNAKQLKTVDHWNNNYSNMKENNPFFPAVFIDMGDIQWSPMIGDTYQSGKTVITLHCQDTFTRDTRDKAYDADGGRLKRFDLSQRAMDIVNGAAAKDSAGNVIFNRLMLTGSTFDTNHAALFDDLLRFTCQVYYYKQWYGLNCKQVVFGSVAPEWDSTIKV